MADLTSEIRAFIHTFKTIRNSHPDLSPDDEFFVGSLEAECSLHRIIGRMVRQYRQEITLEAAMEKAAQNVQDRKEEAGRRAAKLLLQVQATLQQIKAQTGETPAFNGPSYSVTLNPVGIINLTALSDSEDKPIHERVGAKLVEDLYFQRLRVKSEIDQIKDEEEILAEKKRGLVSKIARIDQDILEEAPSLFSPGTKTVKLPIVNITVRDMGQGVIVTDETVLDDKYLIYPPPPPPPPPKPNIPAILMDLKNKVDVLGARLDNGRQSLSFQVKKPT